MSTTVDRIRPDMSDGAKECRLLGHSWPRKHSRGPKPRVHVAARDRKGRVIAIDRVMECTGGCGLIRTDYLSVDPATKRLSRRADPHYDYTDKSYHLRARDENGEKYDEPVDRHEVAYFMLAALYPDLQW